MTTFQPPPLSDPAAGIALPTDPSLDGASTATAVRDPIHDDRPSADDAAWDELAPAEASDGPAPTLAHRLRHPGRGDLLTAAAAVAVVICLVMTALTVQGRVNTSNNERAVQEAQATTRGAEAASVALRVRLDAVTAEAEALQKQVDDGSAFLSLAVAERDQVRLELALTELNLTSLKNQLEGTFALALQQGETQGQLDTCLDAVSRALNQAALGNDALAVAVLFESWDACTQARTAVQAAREQG